MKTIERKNRTRLLRGKLNKFEDLPKFHQDNFLIIKKAICDSLGENTNVYIFGSFYWGFWDEFSDYDVLLDYVYTGFKFDERFKYVNEIKTFLKNKFGFEVDILTMQGELGILIP